MKKNHTSVNFLQNLLHILLFALDKVSIFIFTADIHVYFKMVIQKLSSTLFFLNFIEMFIFNSKR